MSYVNHPAAILKESVQEKSTLNPSQDCNIAQATLKEPLTEPDAD